MNFAGDRVSWFVGVEFGQVGVEAGLGRAAFGGGKLGFGDESLALLELFWRHSHQIVGVTGASERR